MKKSPAEIEALRDAMDAAELDFRNAKIAFHSGTDYKSRSIDYDELRRYVEAFITANYDFQRARWGRVRVSLNPSNLIRE
jgi:Xaa-Pro aminopeptidase